MNTPSTNTPADTRTSIRGRLGNRREGPPRFLWGAAANLSLDDLVNGTTLGGRGAEVAGRSVLVCTPDLPSEHLPALVAKAGIDAIVSDIEAIVSGHDRGDDGPVMPLRILS